MPLLAVAAVLLAVLGLIALVPLSIVLRYRAGTARRQARGWVAVINLGAIGLSAGLFVLAAAVTSLWVTRALTCSLLGLLGGGVLGLLGLALSRWEVTPRSVHYTPSRWLMLTLTLVVLSRMVVGVWRGWHAWQAMSDNASWLAASGAAGSLAAGAVVLGYYLVYWAGVWRRIKQHRRTWSGGDFRRAAERP